MTSLNRSAQVGLLLRTKEPGGFAAKRGRSGFAAGRERSGCAAKKEWSGFAAGKEQGQSTAKDRAKLDEGTGVKRDEGAGPTNGAERRAPSGRVERRTGGRSALTVTLDLPHWPPVGEDHDVMPRPRTSDGVTAHLIDALFTGTLRVGARVDLDEWADRLGVSRGAVRDGLTPLERDGLVRVTPNRGVFVAPFDAGTVRESFDLYGLLSALAFRRAATRRPDELLEVLDELDDALASTTDVDEFEQAADRFRGTVASTVAPPHLRALLQSFSGLVPAATRLSIVEAMAEERSALHAEYTAVRDGDAEAAAAAVLDHAVLTAENAIRELRRRGIIDGDPRNLEERAAHLDLVRRIDERATANWNGPTRVFHQLSR